MFLKIYNPFSCVQKENTISVCKIKNITRIFFMFYKQILKDKMILNKSVYPMDFMIKVI